MVGSSGGASNLRCFSWCCPLFLSFCHSVIIYFFLGVTANNAKSNTAALGRRKKFCVHTGKINVPVKKKVPSKNKHIFHASMSLAEVILASGLNHFPLSLCLHKKRGSTAHSIPESCQFHWCIQPFTC